MSYYMGEVFSRRLRLERLTILRPGDKQDPCANLVFIGPEKRIPSRFIPENIDLAKLARVTKVQNPPNLDEKLLVINRW